MKTETVDNETNQVINRLMAIFNVDKDAALSPLIGVAKQSISTWRQRNSTPFELCVKIAKEKNINLNWLLTGEGEMYLKNYTHSIQETPPAYSVNVINDLSHMTFADLISLVNSLKNRIDNLEHSHS